MSGANPLWDAPRIHGEMLNLGTDERLSFLRDFKFEKIQSTSVQTKQSPAVVSPPQSIFRADVPPLVVRLARVDVAMKPCRAD